MPKRKHEIIKWPKVLYPAVRSKNAAAIRRAVSKVVKPRQSFCICGRNCALNKQHVAATTDTDKTERG